MAIHELMISRLMQYEDQLRSHPGFFRAALGAIDIFTRAFDDPTLGDEVLSECLGDRFEY